MADLAIAPQDTQATPLGPGTPAGVSLQRPANAGPQLSPDELTQLGHSTTTVPLSDAVAIATQSAPNLDPHSVVSIAQTGGDVQQKAEAVGMMKKTNGMIEAATEVNAAHPENGGVDGALSWLGHNVIKPVAQAAELVGKSPIGKGLSDLANIANLPLKDVQHEYRYLHDVEARHGFTAAVAEGLAISAGVIGGSVLFGPDGAILGGEGAAQILGGVMYHDSWVRTANGNTYRDPNTNTPVSFGRDIATVLQARRGSGVYGTLSGVIDGIGDLITDPLALAGKIKAGVSGVEGGAGVIGKHWGGLGLTDPDQIDRAYDTNPSFRRAVQQISRNDTGWVVAHFPKMTPIAQQLGDASSAEEVLEKLKDPIITANLMTDHLPVQSFARSSFQKIRDAAGSYEGPMSDNFIIGPARWTRRFSKVTGSAFDDFTKEFSSKTIDPTADQHAEDVFRFVNYTQNRQVATNMADQWLHAAPGQRIIMLRSMIMDSVAHAAHFTPIEGDEEDDLMNYAEMQDPSVRSAMKAQIDRWTGGGDPGKTGVYGMHNDGSQASLVYDEATNQAWSAAILENQTGKITLPSFTQIKRMGGQLRQLRAAGFLGKTVDDIGYFSGKLDDFAYDAVTQRFFKPLVLMSGSYAWHISLAEMIPNTLRLGLLSSARAIGMNFSSRLGYTLESDEGQALLGSMVQAMGDDGQKLAGLSKSNRQLRMEAEILLDLRTDGHKVPLATSAGENIPKEYEETTRARQVLHDLFNKVPSHHGDKFGVKEASKEAPSAYLNYWRDAIREANRSPASQMALKALIAGANRGLSEDDAVFDAGKVAASELKKMTPEELSHYQRAYLYSKSWHDDPRPKPQGWTPIDDWGQEVAQNLRSLLGRTHINGDLLQHMAHGTTPTSDRLATIMDQDEWPVAVKGRIHEPGASTVMGTIANAGFKYAINPFVNFMSRQPLMRNEFFKQWKQLRPLVENGVYDLDEASNIALNRAIEKSIRFVHNLHDRTQLSETLRNWIPFYFAQEQAYRRMGRLLTEDPGAFRRYQMMISGIGQMAASGNSGVNGDKYYMIPGGTFLSAGSAYIMSHVFRMKVQNLDVGQLQTSLSSANVIFPLSSGFRPDLSPVAAVAAKALYAIHPEFGPDLNKLVGSQTLTSQIWTLGVPNTAIQRLLEALPIPGIGQSYDRSYVTAMNQAIQFAAYQQNQELYKWIVGGKKGPEPHIIPPDATAGVNASGGFEATKAQQDFINRINNQTSILFVTNLITSFFSPTSTTPAVKDFGFTAAVNAEITKEKSVSKGVQAFLLKNPLATPYTVWQSYSASGATLPTNDAGENWINGHQNFINKYPNVAFFMMPNTSGPYDYAVYNEQLAQGDRVKRSPQQFLNALYVAAGNAAYYPQLDQYEAIANAPGTSGTARSNAYNAFQEWLTPFSAAHPIWAAMGPLNTAAKNATMQQAIGQIGQMVQSHDVPNNPQASKVVSLYNSYQQFNVAYINANSAHNYSTVQRDLRDNWRAYLQAVEQKNPDLSETISSVFMDALGVTNAGASGSQG
jgi:hypothetical protein